MSKVTRRKFTPEFKSKVCLEVIKEHQTIEVISKKYSLHPTVVNNWKREFLKNSPVVFEKESSNSQDDKDQLIQMLSEIYTSFLKHHSIAISMDGKGRAIDNIFIERLWRSVKYENIYLNVYEDGLSLYHGLKHYFKFYNDEGRHQSLDYQTPGSIYKSQAA